MNFKTSFVANQSFWLSLLRVWVSWGGTGQEEIEENEEEGRRRIVEDDGVRMMIVGLVRRDAKIAWRAFVVLTENKERGIILHFGSVVFLPRCACMGC